MDTSRAIVIGAVTLSIAVLIAGYAVKPARYQITRISEGVLVRFDTTTGETKVCRISQEEVERDNLVVPCDGIDWQRRGGYPGPMGKAKVTARKYTAAESRRINQEFDEMVRKAREKEEEQRAKAKLEKYRNK